VCITHRSCLDKIYQVRTKIKPRNIIAIGVDYTLYLYFIEPKRAVIPVSYEALIGRKGYEVEIRTDRGTYQVGSDITVSREHARIYMVSKAYYIEDLGSLNGTRVNGELIKGWKPRSRSEPVELTIGSVVEIGIRTMFRVEAVEHETPAEAKKKDRCASLKSLNKALNELFEHLYIAGEGRATISDILPILEYIVSKESFRNELDSVYNETIGVDKPTSKIEHYIHLFKTDPQYYQYRRDVLNSLREIVKEIRKIINLEYDNYC